MLAVNVHQLAGQYLELGHGGRAAVDPGTAAAFGVDRAAQQQAVLQRETLLLQPGGQAGRGIELGGDFAARRTLAHHAAVGACAQGELQRVDQDGLAGAGFTGEHAKALVQFQVQ
ncbi:hypothetical protein D9M68_930270 [compost metagenome]